MGQKMLRAVMSIGGLALISGAAFGQEPEAAVKFELATVHPSPHSTNPDASDMSGGLMGGGRYQLRRATMLDLIRTAYGVDGKKVLGGPNWLEVDRFDIRAKVPAGTTPAAVKPMLRALLKERFGLSVHDDTKPVPAWALTAGKHPQMKQSDGSGDTGCRMNQQAGPGRGASEAGPGAARQAVPLFDIACHNMTMADFAAGMNNIPGAWNFVNDNLVVDQTGLEGAWDFSLKYSRRGRAVVAGAEIVSLFDAVDRLGLKLDPAMAPVSVIVVDSVNRAPTPDSPETAKSFPPLPTEFEVADIKPTAPETQGGPDIQLQAGGRLTMRGVTLKFLVEEIWGLTDDMLIGAPKFMDSDRWDIVAKAPDVMAAEGDADIDALFQMAKNLLAERFKLAVHTEERPVSAYTMTASKPKMKKADPASRTSCKEGPPTLVKVDPRSTNPVLGRLMSCTNTTMAYLAEQLQFLANGYVHSAVLDSTGLEGGWDFTLSFSTAGQFQGGVIPPPGASAASDPNGAISLPDAMEKQLGLKLEPQKRPVPVLVIDHIEQKPTEN